MLLVSYCIYISGSEMVEAEYVSEKSILIAKSHYKKDLPRSLMSGALPKWLATKVRVKRV